MSLPINIFDSGLTIKKHSEDPDISNWHPFEKDLYELFVGDIKNDKQKAHELWSALTNIQWKHPDLPEPYDITFRSAGDLIAEIRACGESYMDYYCASPDCVVTDWIKDKLATKGYTSHDL